jgi:hypothetical protein
VLVIVLEHGEVAQPGGARVGAVDDAGDARA